MREFKDFGITTDNKDFEGDKIKIFKILDKEIIVHAFKLENSKCFPEKGNGKCLYMQITFNDEKRVVFTSSVGLIDAIARIPEDGFPFTTRIVKDNEKFKFT